MAKKKDTKVVVTCNKCGNKMEVEIPEHEQFALGIAVGKDSGLGEVELPTVGGKKEDKTQKQLEALKKAGIDTSRFFAMGGKLFEPSGDGTIHEVQSDNPTVKKILEGRFLYNSHLFKQHVLAQLFKALTETRYVRGRGPVHVMEKTREGEYECARRISASLASTLVWRMPRSSLRSRRLRMPTRVMVDTSACRT